MMLLNRLNKSHIEINLFKLPFPHSNRACSCIIAESGILKYALIYYQNIYFLNIDHVLLLHYFARVSMRACSTWFKINE